MNNQYHADKGKRARNVVQRKINVTMNYMVTFIVKGNMKSA